MTLDGSSQLACAVRFVETFCNQEFLGFRSNRQLDFARFNPLLNPVDFEVENDLDIFHSQLTEDDDIVETVDQLGFEGVFAGIHHHFLKLFVIAFRTFGGEAEATLGNMAGPNVGGHNNDRVAEIDAASETIGQSPLFENLKHHMHHVGMSLFDFVEQHNRIRAAADTFGELSSLFVADIPGR